jgi:hypothetical protein
MSQKSQAKRTRLATGLYVGESLQIGDTLVTLKELRGKHQAKIVVEASPEVRIEKIRNGQETRN